MKGIGIIVQAVIVATLCVAAPCAQGKELDKRIDLEFASNQLAHRDGVAVTQADFDAYLRDRVPEDKWGAILSSPERISEVINNLLLTQALANAALADQDMMDESLTALLYRKITLELAALYRQQYVEERQLDSYESAARELYMTRSDQFTTPPTIDIEHILIADDSESSETELMRRALDVHERISDGEDFPTLAREVSDERNAGEDGGMMTEVEPESLVRPLANALKEIGPGELAEPVRTQYGWHIARLVRENPPEELSWEEARPRAEDVARNQHRQKIWERHLRELRDSPAEIAEGAIAELLERHGVEDLNNSIDENVTPSSIQN